MRRILATAGTWLVLIVASSSAACVEAPQVTDPGERVSYQRDIQPIWDQWCNRCHNFHTPHLTAGASTDLLESSWFKCRKGSEHAPFVVPGDPAASFLIYKLTGEDPDQYWDREACDRLMPADQPGGDMPLIRLDPDAVEKVRLWVQQGAALD